MSGQANVAPTIIKRKKIVAGDGHHGGAWKVAYADFVTAMMAFFMMMWLLNATTETQRRGLADYFSPTVPISRQSGGGDGVFSGDTMFAEDTKAENGIGATNIQPEKQTQAKTPKVDDALEADTATQEKIEEALTQRAGESAVSDDIYSHVTTRITDEGMVVELFDLEDAVLFEGDTDIPTPLLQELAWVVSDIANSVPNSVAIEGHVAAVPIVQAQDPVWGLSASRADQFRTLLESTGMSPTRMQRVTGHADRELISSDPMSIRNNRIEVIFLRE